MLKILFTAFLVFATFMLFRNSKKLPWKKGDKSGNTPVELVKDPICETFIERDTLYKVKYYDNYYYFCSEECREKFINQMKKRG